MLSLAGALAWLTKLQSRTTVVLQKSLSARGLTTREMQQRIQEIYKVEVSPTSISNITGAVREDVVAWQNRPPDKKPRSCLT